MNGGLGSQQDAPVTGPDPENGTKNSNNLMRLLESNTLASPLPQGPRIAAKSPTVAQGNCTVFEPIETVNQTPASSPVKSLSPSFLLPEDGQVYLHSALALPPEDGIQGRSFGLLRTYEDEPSQPLYSRNDGLSNGLGAPPHQARPDITSNVEPLPSSTAATTTTEYSPTTEIDKRRPDRDVTEDNDGAVPISKNSASVLTRQQDPLRAVDCPTPIETNYTLPEQTEGGRSTVENPSTDNSITASQVSLVSTSKGTATTCKRPIGDEDTESSGIKGSPAKGNSSAMGITQGNEAGGHIIFASSCGGSDAASNALKDSTYVSEPAVGAGCSTAGPSTAIPPLRLSSSNNQSNERRSNAYQPSPSSSRPTVANECAYAFNDQANPISSRYATTTNEDEVSPLYASNHSTSYPSLPRNNTRIITTGVARNLVDTGASLESGITYSCDKQLERKLSIGSHGNIGKKEDNKLTKPLCVPGINVLADPKSSSHPWYPSHEMEQPDPYEVHKPSLFLHSVEVSDLEDYNPQSGSTPPMELNGLENLENVQDNKRTPWLASRGASVYQEWAMEERTSSSAVF
ncbi:hypothetical protein FAGAP_11944 [Fusarium agapanthi]|uniref:Uncharacterized protein n=1 Tax=Fusarium agapanthi TaxID=1803897 RepID=A0A9P5E397_9HYPO|nr:hypothetical protein FAGAP_11944 [Fusarium agapanthi]